MNKNLETFHLAPTPLSSTWCLNAHPLSMTRIVYLDTNYFCIPEMFKTYVSSRFLSTKSPFEFVFFVVNSQKLFCGQKADVKW